MHCTAFQLAHGSRMVLVLATVPPTNAFHVCVGDIAYAKPCDYHPKLHLLPPKLHSFTCGQSRRDMAPMQGVSQVIFQQYPMRQAGSFTSTMFETPSYYHNNRTVRNAKSGELIIRVDRPTSAMVDIPPTTIFRAERLSWADRRLGPVHYTS